MLGGNEEAFEELFERFFPALYRFALARLAGDPDAAEEVVQSTLIKAVAKLATYRGEAALLTWLCTICRHEIGAFCATAPVRMSNGCRFAPPPAAGRSGQGETLPLMVTPGVGLESVPTTDVAAIEPLFSSVISSVKHSCGSTPPPCS